MIRHSFFLLLVVGLAASAGCCCVNGSRSALSACTGCGSSDCGGDCGGGCQVGRCGPRYGGMRYDCGDPCQRSCWGLPLFRNLFNCTGCGETYWSEWRNDPPACRDSCDCHGNWTGPYGAQGGYQGPYEEGPYMEMDSQHSEPTPAADPTPPKTASRTAHRVPQTARYTGYSRGIVRGR